MGGGAAASLFMRPLLAAGPVEIAMRGTANGARVWFDPAGLLVPPGTILRWTNADAGNAHTATAFPDRVPEGAEPFGSRYLLPGKSFETRLDVPGVYDYFCLPHRHAGMVGRILVGDAATPFADYPPGDLARIALDRLPPIGDIVSLGRVETTP